ncbi:MAG: cytochrome b/b6 domain-containing protein [Burkholderiaceae bacterium]|nr:cytochrome b/b6 domain-containing protein [Burkholderiaceae bacterium]
MNTTSASRADSATQNTAAAKVLVWDAPVRVFHWLMVLSFAGAYLTAESERWRLAHVTLGYTMAALVLFRLVWGLIGTRHARFASFVRGPATVKRYLAALLRGKPEHYTGHNPAGALAIIALLGAALIVTAAGWATYNELGGEWLEELHEAAANAMLALVGVHVGGVVVSSLLHKENLVGAMISGRKKTRPGDAIKRAWRGVAALLLAGVLGFWWWQWQQAPAAGNADQTATQVQRHASNTTKDA